MCWRQLWDVGDGFVCFYHQHPLSFNISIGHQQSKDVTNIEVLSLTSKNCHQHLLSLKYLAFSTRIKFLDLNFNQV